MLPAEHRLRLSAAFRRAFRTGRRAGSTALVLHLASSPPVDAPEAPRVGFVVGRQVGPAVVRNRVRRRIKAIGWQLATEVQGIDVVVRALPAAAAAPFADLEGEVRAAVQVLAGREAA